MLCHTSAAKLSNIFKSYFLGYWMYELPSLADRVQHSLPARFQSPEMCRRTTRTFVQDQCCSLYQANKLNTKRVCCALLKPKPGCLSLLKKKEPRWSSWSRGLGTSSAASRFLGLTVRIPPEDIGFCLFWMLCFVQVETSCNEPITRPEESYRVGMCVCHWVYVCECVSVWVCVCMSVSVFEWVCVSVSVCVSLSVISCNNNPQHLKWVHGKCQNNKEKKERK